MAQENSKKTYRVFVSSPGDVETERKIVLKAIEEFNNIFRDLNHSVSFESVAWEKDTHSGAGKPQDVIKEQISLDTIDILIVILWKRFGTPTNTRPAGNNQSYFSGTQQEFEEAYTNWEKTKRPLIMVYRKIAFVPPQMTEDEFLQLQRVHQFFEQCKPDGKHPMFVKEFQEGEFDVLLRNELGKAVNRLESIDIESLESKNISNNQETSCTLYPTTRHNEKNSFWRKLGLAENPFSHKNAEYEPDLLNYFVRFPNLNLSSTDPLIYEVKPWFIVGEAGSGKTSLIKFLASKTQPEKPSSNALCFIYNHRKFSEILEKSQNISSFGKNFWGALYDFCVQKCPKETQDKIINSSNNENSLERLVQVLDILKMGGVKHLLCLIDTQQESFRLGAGDIKYTELLAYLAQTKESKILNMRYFLLPSIYNDLQKETPDIFHSDYGYLLIEWDEESLKNIISRRMMFFSEDATVPILSIAQIDTNDNKNIQLVDQEIIREAKKTPRSVLYYADDYLSQMQFVNTKSRVLLVLEADVALKNLENRSLDNYPKLLCFWGNRGIGKTTLLNAIAKHLTNRGNVITQSFDIKETIPNKDSISSINHRAEKLFVVFFDNLDFLLQLSRDGNLFFEFERNIILPLVQRNDTLIVTSSQIELNQWREDDVLFSQRNYHLTTFTKEDVLMLLSRKGLDVGRAYSLTLGQPAAIQWLLDNPTLGEREIAQKAFEYFLEEIPEDAIKIAEIIAVLPIFNGFVLKEIINREHENPVEYLDILEWLKEYIRRGLVYWDVEIGSYCFTDSAVRRLLARCFAYQQPDKFYARHEFAMKHFQAEARSPGYLHMHLPSAIYHSARILTLQEKPIEEVGQACLEWVQSNLNAWLSARWDEVLENWENSLGEQAIREQSIREEIIEMIGKATFDAITSELEAVKRKMEVTQ